MIETPRTRSYRTTKYSPLRLLVESPLKRNEVSDDKAFRPPTCHSKNKHCLRVDCAGYVEQLAMHYYLF